MTDHPTIDGAIDAQLVAYLHGELDANERRAMGVRLARDPDARARLAVLESADRALGEALEREDAPRQSSRLRSVLQPMLALAALVAVVAIFVFQQQDELDSAAKNEHLELRIAPAGGGTAPLFTDAAFELFWSNLTTGDPRRQLRVVPFPFGTTREQLGAEMDRSTHIGSRRMAVLPVVVTAEIRDPTGKVLQARLAPGDSRPFQSSDQDVVHTVRLRDFEITLATPRPAFVGNPGDREWLDDAEWGFRHMAKDETARWFPELPGEWRIELRVDTLPAPEYSPWPTFEEPLSISSAIVMSGQITDWGEAHDGMRARLLWSTGARTADTTPFALQLQNESQEARKYNHVGTTMAKIPQPMHYTLIVDGQEWTQREGIPLIIPAGELFQPHPVGAVRSFVTRPEFWRSEGRSLGQLPGSHTVQVMFHSEPLLWNAADTSIWLGKLYTPALTIDVPKPR